ncbi:hypothetical protein PSA7680_03011 [Pseudoruegeria aquimaris]|uniref:Cobalamin biosynthesis protein CobQ n=1 Tax=Pseudoruegeria aquimaris TaxID=393663 RepID=A0A1Y5T7B1_9RHOB|nr:cobalamin biosynthesis protein CobQ [Pseudoruegeria aquimaris]SLN57511.1 hypothetical protein PSA7680_03011 [Pseudoruegeria aquimaris]
MNTPAHLLLGAAVFARPKARAVTAAALLGALMPDLSLYLLAGGSIYVLGIPPETVFDEYYFSDGWQTIFAIDNSFVLWGALFAFALWWRRAPLIAFAGSGLLHLVTDFLLHNDDARRQFWPLSDWVFHSPVSYWDPAHYGRIMGPLEALLCLALGVILWRRFHGPVARLSVLLLLGLEILPWAVFILILGGG